MAAADIVHVETGGNVLFSPVSMWAMFSSVHYHQNPVPEVVKVPVSVTGSLDYFDRVVASFCKPVTVGAVKCVQDIRMPVRQHRNA